MKIRTIAIANRHPRLKLDRRSVSRAIHVLDQRFAAETKRVSLPLRVCPPGELSLVFLTDAELAQLHGQFLDDPSRTDVITFEGNVAAQSAGEICVSVDTAVTYAKQHRRDFSSELMLYLVHGWLHLAGYDDLEPAKKRVMRRAEQRAMTLLEDAKVPPRFTLR
ncbi:MAG: rRNA maturation RNase YbeY [Opitutus sp.]